MSKKLTYLIVFLFLLLVLVLLFLFFIRSAGESLPSSSSELERDKSKHDTFSQAFILPLAEASYFPLRDFNVPDLVMGAKSVLLFDTRSGKFLYQKDPYKQLPIASLTKLMTAVVIMENLSLDSIITVSAEDINVDGFGADLMKGEKLRGVDLLKIMLIKSSNDAALVFQSYTKKQGVDLVEKMNQKAVELGMSSTHFTDPAGLDDDALSTAADLLKLVQYVGASLPSSGLELRRDRHPLIWSILTTPAIEVTSIDGAIRHSIVNTDRLLGQVPDIVGGKTGFTDKAMGTMILLVSVDRGLSNLIGVVLGSNDRFSDVRRMIEWGKAAYRWH